MALSLAVILDQQRNPDGRQNDLEVTKQVSFRQAEQERHSYRDGIRAGRLHGAR
jgi:hypothetical protein